MSNFNKEDWLHNDCQSEKVAKCAAAAWAHEATMSTQMFLAESDHYSIEMAADYLENPESQEVIFIEFLAYSDHEKTQTSAVIYEKEDLVMLCHWFSFDDEEENYFEPGYPMTTSGFFSYLNSLPNIKKHVHPSALDDKHKLGLSLLDELSQ
ncbi:hypothetical protein P3696_18745 [Vibrio parahaemolyticus]|nr:hypothetical protein [Vibrio parahaemolyticus]MDF5500506.1 hypothetical protein [Vibrio parahaemolyticus]MDF5511240.1 hypothetical protein [Vibrio parahaemolyticus]MDF5558887.1 hypothetical protein [Vibrio parahaemolyticus]